MVGGSCTVGDMSTIYIGICAERSDVFHYSLLSILYSLLPLHGRVRDAARYGLLRSACTRAADSRPY
ncbi:MAG: hypothetical protein ACI3V2_04715 [Faecousia sp.]